VLIYILDLLSVSLLEASSTETLVNLTKELVALTIPEILKSSVLDEMLHSCESLNFLPQPKTYMKIKNLCC